MSKLIVITGFIFLTGWVCVESIYTHSVTTIEGVNKSLNAYQGKKMLIMTLPINRNNSNDLILHSLDSLRNAYNGSLVIIASPSYEDGYTPAKKDSLKQWYRSILSMDVIVTAGMYTRKTSGSRQHALFRWLTDKTRNEHFDRDVFGPKNKFIVWTDGELVGVLGAPTRIGSSTLNNLLQGQ
jgi:glutathione peroxidase